MSNKIELKSISELLGMNFFIPNYQRGYRWTKQQVKDLLDDIQEFIDKNHEGFYCIQPLVVRERKQETFELIKNEAKDLDEIKNLLKGRWEVIDGQQRLTTIYILLTFLQSVNKYRIEYETRPDSKSFLSDIKEEKKEENIDYYHIVEAKTQIVDWFNNKTNEIKLEFFETLLEKVKFIWYESVDEDPIKVFTRLNIGKISLTNAELIKALFLNKFNFKDVDYKKIRLQQQEIANEWDIIENKLQNDEFWLFLNELNYDKPTRIDLIFDLIYQQNKLSLSSEEMKDIGTDEYKTFRYFYYCFKKKTDIDILEYWAVIKLYFQTFQEWFNDLELYHYVGFLVEYKIIIPNIIQQWNNTKNTKEIFLNKYIIPEIKSKISQCIDLNKQYEINGSPKTQCRPILLLHNIQTIINQNKTLIKDEKYKLPVFYKFPFHLFKKEKWDVEHIDSHTENPLEDEKGQKEWLKYSYEYIGDEAKFESGENIKIEIKKFIAGSESKKEFPVLWQEVISKTYTKAEKLKDGIIDNNGNVINEKDKLWNFTLLDYSTNRSYGNDIFPAKRRILIGKDQGKKISIDDELKVNESEGAIAFIPPCTKNVFLKYYSKGTSNLREWTKEDAEAYLENIKTNLNEFLK